MGSARLLHSTFPIEGLQQSPMGAGCSQLRKADILKTGLRLRIA